MRILAVLFVILISVSLFSFAQETTPIPQIMSLSQRAEIFWAHQKEIYDALGITELQLQAIDEIIEGQRGACEPVLDNLKQQLADGTITLEEYQAQMKIRLSGYRELTLQKIEAIFTDEQAAMYPLVLESLK